MAFNRRTKTLTIDGVDLVVTELSKKQATAVDKSSDQIADTFVMAVTKTDGAPFFANKAEVDEVPMHVVTRDGRTATRVFKVKDDAGANLTMVAAETAPGIPLLGSAHPEDSTRKCVSVKPRPMEVRDRCIVDVSYSKLPNDEEENPLNDPDVWSIDTVESDEEYYVDASDDANKCILTNGKPITPRPKRKAIGYLLVIKKNVAPAYSLSNFGTYNNRLNSDTVSYGGATAEEGQAHLIMNLSEVQERNDIKYRVLTLNVNIREEGHRQKYDSRDKEELIDDELKPIKDQFGRQVGFAWPLDEFGAKMPSVDDDPFEIELVPYGEVAMNGFINA